ncbi:HU family DNA-binding protein [Megasphaera sp.]|uniref:HU family DNA-binding protein n=1 Tax=Megasphaera sp. TaxID=2023260 RepID=UPI003F7E9B25
MNKTELIAAVANETEITKKDAEKAVKAVFSVISDSLTKGDKIQIIGFGTFKVRQRKAREGRNPRTNEPIQIEASKTPAFKAGKQLKDLVNGK